MVLAALAAELQPRASAFEKFHVPVAQRGQPVGAIAARVFGVAHAHQGVGQQRHHDRQHLFAREARQQQIATQAPPQFGQRSAEGDHAFELALAAYLRPLGVIAILLAPPGIAPGGLQMPVGLGADPHFGIGRRNRQRTNALQGLGIGNALPVGIAVTEALAGLAAADAGLLIVDVGQPGRTRGGPGLRYSGCACHGGRGDGGAGGDRRELAGGTDGDCGIANNTFGFHCAQVEGLAAIVGRSKTRLRQRYDNAVCASHARRVTLCLCLGIPLCWSDRCALFYLLLA
ncbi:hypothetical protein XAP412_550027 [Xanthomonas phaseoli pv. phaseoli]|uniref:Uncharacterized protein n=1 Tax=Xanthomonas campestris pv. phaseoli TaxID=317013 RepID=A0AB38E3W4_XANCH|nr:hypothetical protein XAP6984_600026 [Xanthomonas phaseoli pv. phaseoli]SON87789.1 hypothetical protein XAP412_550027 [Xanthomonas phaseoli pv. phaseoli]SON91434.1 hypothetical protein XAP7430_560026 [Xanthomonas phaseoli pv. phaseoli]